MDGRLRVVALGVGLALATAGLTSAGPAAAAAVQCRSGVAADVNGDGHAEVAVTEFGGPGRVHVFYGRSSGLVTGKSGTALNDQIFAQGKDGVPGSSETYPRFGDRTAFGDFNGDGCADLAISATSALLEGTVTIIYGSKTGLTTRGLQRFTSAQVFGDTDRGYESFGSALAVGDFDDDGTVDLGVARSPSSETGGSVVVLFGDADGLTQGRASEVLSAGVGGYFPSLAVGDFDGKGVEELALGLPDAIYTVARGAGGFASAQPKVLSAASLGIPEADTDGSSAPTIMAGDFDGDRHSDLAMGFTNGDCEDGNGCGPGSVAVVRGTPTGLTSVGHQLWTQQSPGVGGVGRNEDDFGLSLTAGRFDADGTDDLAIGAPGDWVGSIAYAGTVTLMLGSSDGLTTAGAGGTRLHQDLPGIPRRARDGEQFGRAVSAAHVQGKTQDNLVIGVTGESVGGVGSAGLVHQLSVGAAGPRGQGSATLYLDAAGVKGKATLGAFFGWWLG